MHNSIFPEKRTRSQITLPDDILKVSDKSPLKDARTALRNNAAIANLSYETIAPANDSDDELLLSPSKRDNTPKLSSAHGLSKRSVSPPPGGDYPKQGLPQEGRELKRLKQDSDMNESPDIEIKLNVVSQRLKPTHARTNSEPVDTSIRRSSRRRAGTALNKPFTAASLSPPPLELSPSTSSAKGRAQSVPLFSSSYPMPHIDLANPPASPRHLRSRSRSPSKEREPKLRITPVTMKPVDVLSVIPDESGVMMEVDDNLAGSHPELKEVVPKEDSAKKEESIKDCLTEKDAAKEISSECVSQKEEIINVKEDDMKEESVKKHNSQADLGERVLEPDVAKVLDTKEIETRETTPGKETSSKATTQLPETSVQVLDGLPRDSEPTSASNVPTHGSAGTSASITERPTTPLAAQYQIPFTSPLTPIPDTPQADTPISGSRYASSAGWGMTSGTQEEEPALFPEIKPTATLRKSESQSRLPRLSLAPGATFDDSTKKKASEMGPPTITPSKAKAFAPRKLPISVVGNKNTVPGATNAFSLMMKKPSVDSKLTNKSQGKQIAGVSKPSKPIASSSKPGPSTLFPAVGASKISSKSKIKKPEETLVAPRKPTIKAKMRPREKPPKPKIAPVPAPIETQDSESEAAETDVEQRKGETKPIDEPPLSEPQGPIMEPSVPTRPPSPSIGDGDLSMQDVTGILDLPPTVPGPSAANKTESIALDSTGSASVQEQEQPRVSITDDPRPAMLTDLTPKWNAPHASGGLTPDSVPGEPPYVTAHKSTSHDADANSRTLPIPSKSKLPQVKKRTPIAVPATSRVTRSVSSGKKQKVAEEPSLKAGKPQSRVRQVLNGKAPSMPASVDVPQLAGLSSSTSSSSKLPTECEADPSLPPGSPMKISSPVRQPKTTPKKMISPPKAVSSPSPFKLSRSASLFSVRERRKSIDQGNGQSSAGGSSLSTLSNALEKLRMPAPLRPNTSMGFNRGLDVDDDDDTFTPQSVDDGAVVQKASVLERPTSSGLKRSATLGADDLREKLSSQAMVTTVSKPLVQRPLSSFIAGKTGATTSKDLQSGTGAIMRAGKPVSSSGSKPRIFGVGSGGIFGTGARRTAPKASRIPTLPSVMGSPVKGCDALGDTVSNIATDRPMDEDLATLPKLNFMGDLSIDDSYPSGEQDSADLVHIISDKGKGKGRAGGTWKKDASRRASMASQLLSQSLSSLSPPEPSGRSIMGPPVTPPRGVMRSSSSTYPSSISPARNPTTTRSSTRLVNTVPSAIGKVKSGTNASVPSNRKGVNESTPEGSTKSAPESLKILKDCVIYVDIRTDDGEEAGSLFVEMLEGAGARVLTRVGQTCTHIVYKNGLTSTLNRYRLLRDPKPFVVGIAWVVDCVEQRKRVDESTYLIDLDDVNIAGTNKRRRSMLPKFISREFSDAGSSDAERDQHGDADNSMDESNSSVTMDDHLPPLERARRRKSMLVGPQS